MKKSIINKRLFGYFCLLFLFLILYNLLINQFSIWKNNDYWFSFYLFDFSFGLCTRFLPGAIYHIFFKEVVEWQLNLFSTLLLLLMFAGVAYLLAIVIDKQKDETIRARVLLLILFLLTGSSTFSIFSSNLGIYDTFWILFSIAFLLLLPHKFLRFFVPIFFVLSIMVQFHCLLSFILFYGIVLLYQAVFSDGKEKRIYTIILVISCIACLGTVLYFAAFEKSNLVYTWEDCQQLLERRNPFHSKSSETFLQYFQGTYYTSTDIEPIQALYDKYHQHYWFNPSQSFVPESLINLVNGLCLQAKTCFYFYQQDLSGSISQFLITNALTLPLIVLFYRYWIKKAKQEQTALTKLVYILPMVQYPLICFGFLLATDIVRLLTHAFLVQFALFIFILYKKNDWDYLKEAYLWRSDYRYYILYLICYMCIVIKV